jgi:hypothetical protein
MTKVHREIIWLIIHHGDFSKHVGLLSENSQVSAGTLITSIFGTHTQNGDGDGKNCNKNMNFLLCRLQSEF